jgi:predicted PurR-regulated permease PerM
LLRIRISSDCCPTKDQIVEKLSEFASKAGGWIALGLAVGVKGTAAFFLSLSIILYATFYFLTDLRRIIDAALQYTPLTSDDRSRLLGTFVSVARATLKGKLIVGIVRGGMAGLSLWVAGIQGALSWSAVMAVLSAVPSVGTALVWVPAVAFLARKDRLPPPSASPCGARLRWHRRQRAGPKANRQRY